MRMIRHARFAIAFGALLCTPALPLQAFAGGGSSVVIELGDTKVTRSEVDDRFRIAVRLLARRQGISLADQDPSVIAQLREQYLDKYATELVMLKEAEHRQLEVSREQVDKSLAEVFASESDEGAFLADTELGESAPVLLRQVLRDEKTIEFLTEVMLKEIRIPPGDVITLHHDVKDRLATPEEVCVRHIQSESVDAANDVLAELERGADFAELARLRSSDAASAENGGDLGCFERSHSAARSEFEKIAFAAEQGRLAGPVESRFGHHVLIVYEHRMPRAPTLNEAYAQIERDLALEQLPQRLQALVSNSGISVYPEKFRVSAN
ncbi:MAG: peptidylprolyl isomerase [Gammaproteobacteria bacterium]|nr:peptidylprolyl isomerase [Gammaproteobacteria bacterium]